MRPPVRREDGAREERRAEAGPDLRVRVKTPISKNEGKGTTSKWENCPGSQR